MKGQHLQTNRVPIFLGAAMLTAALSLAAIQLRRRQAQIQANRQREQLLDQAVEDTMDCSDPVAVY